MMGVDLEYSTECAACAHPAKWPPGGHFRAVPKAHSAKEKNKFFSFEEKIFLFHKKFFSLLYSNEIALKEKKNRRFFFSCSATLDVKKFFVETKNF